MEPLTAAAAVELLTPAGARAILATYYAVLSVLALFGVHRLLLLAAWWRSRRQPLVAPAAPAEWPRVVVQLPLYNERFVAERLLRAVGALDYPRDRLLVQVLDDSTDDTSERVSAAAAELHRAGVEVHHLRRADRRGFKAGALAAGMAQCDAPLLCVFDADFVPRPDFLRRVVPWFADPAVGMVQARWSHLNRSWSLATRAQALLLDGHFAIEHAGRHRSGCFFNFNGTAGVWRREAIVDGGGWQADTLTEDLDLSYRAQLAGWKFVFLPDVEVPAELPVEAGDFKSQQHRWAQGSLQTARKLLPRLLRAPLPWRVRLEAAVHLTNNVSYLLLVVLALLIFPAMMLRRGAAAWQLLAVDLPLFLTGTVSVLLFYLASQAAIGRSWWRTLPTLPAVLAMGTGLSVCNTSAVLRGLVRRGGTFHRTPKYKVEDEAAGAPRTYANPLPVSFWIEGALALYFLACCVVAFRLGMWLSIPFLWLFLQGYGYLFLLALLPRLRPAQEDGEDRDLGQPGGELALG